MSYKSEVVGALRDLFTGGRKTRKDLAQLRLEFDAFRNLTKPLAGSEHTEGLTLDPPFVMVQITAQSGAMWQGRRIIPINDTANWNMEQGQWWVDDADPKPYFIEPGGPGNGIPFYGAYCLIRLAYTKRWVLSANQPDVAIYHLWGGECQGIYARISGAPDANNKYPFEQLYVHPDDRITDETPGYLEQPYGKAKLLGQAAVDPVVTGARIAYPENTIVFLRPTSFQGDFQIDAFCDVNHGPCS